MPNLSAQTRGGQGRMELGQTARRKSDVTQRCIEQEEESLGAPVLPACMRDCAIV